MEAIAIAATDARDEKKEKATHRNYLKQG